MAVQTEYLKPLLESLKEFARIAVLAAIPIVVDGLERGGVDWRLAGLASLIAALKALDKFVHKYGKENADYNLAKGLTRF